MRIIIDTDPGVDDALALLYLAAHPEAEIVAVGSVHGNVPSPVGAGNALRVLEVANQSHVPVAVGARRPLAQPLHTAEAVHGQDGLGGQAGARPARQPSTESAAEQLVRLARANPGELTLLALAPLTNVAIALLLEPELPKLLRSVVVMGGAIAVPGNVTSHSEANVWHDPEAADLVFGAGFDLTLVPLDLTQTALADATWLADLEAIPGPRATFVAAILRHYTDFYSSVIGHRGCALHDPITAAILLDPALAQYRQASVAVELRGVHTRGQTVADLRNGADHVRLVPHVPVRGRIRVATSADIPAFLARMLDALRDPPLR